MEILSQKTFDIFRYIFPGLFVTAIYAIFKSSEIVHPDDIISNLIDKIQLNRAIFLILGSYVLGIAHDQFCVFLVKMFRLKNSMPPEYTSPSNIKSSVKYSLVRHFSPKNLNEIDKWNMLKGMCVNISGFLVYFFICCWYKIFIGCPFMPWFSISIIAMVCSILLFIRSKIYFGWALQDLDSTLDSLNLIEKGKLINKD